MMFGSVNVPGTLALSGSPRPEVDSTKYCAFAAWVAVHAACAFAFRGSSRNQAGMPVASERRPTAPAPNSVCIRA
jgi:hypothetical protein